MMWIETTTGAINSRYVIRVERDKDGTVLHLVDGTTARSPMLFDVVNGQLAVIEPIDDDIEF
jgi:hypothetical protein